MKLDKKRFIFLVNKAVSINAETLHHAKTTGQCSIGHHPHYHVSSFWSVYNEVPECVMGGGSLRNLVILLRFYSMNEIWEFYGVLYEKHWNVVANKVIDAFFCVEFGCKAAGISDCV